MDSNPSPEHVRNYVFPVSHSGGRKLKPFRTRVCQSDSHELKPAALRQCLPSSNFLVHKAARFVISPKSAGEHDCRHGARSARAHSGLTPHATRCETHNPASVGLDASGTGPPEAPT